MILCVQKDALPQSKDVQRKVDLGNLLETMKYFDNEESALKHDPVYVPIDFMVTVRSVRTNLVLERDSKEFTPEKRYYTNMVNIDLLPHKGYDLIMYLSSIGVVSSFKSDNEFFAIMMKSQFCPIGLYNPDPDLFNPIIYSHVLLADEVISDATKFLLDGNRFVPIAEMKREGNLPAILDTLIIVKEESHESADHNDTQLHES